MKHLTHIPSPPPPSLSFFKNQNTRTNAEKEKRNLQLRPPPTPQRSPILIRRLRIRRLSLQAHRITQLTRISLCQLLQRFLSLLSTLLFIITIQIPLRGRRSCRDVVGKSLAACSCEVLVFEGGAVVVATVQVSFGGGGSESGFLG